MNFGRLLIVLFLVHALPANAECIPSMPSDYKVDGGNKAEHETFYALLDRDRAKACLQTLKSFLSLFTAKKEFKLGEILQGLQLNQGSEYQDLGDGFLLQQGCKAHDCGTKAFVFMNPEGTQGVVGLLKGKELQVFTNLNSIPSSVRRSMDDWKAKIEKSERKASRDWTIREITL